MTALAHLSLQHCRFGVAPQAPTNDDRVRAYRAALPVVHANNVFTFRNTTKQATPAKDMK